MRLILMFLGLAQALDINSVYNIDELIEFATGAVNNPSEGATELGALEIDGKKNYAEIIESYLITYPHDEDKEEKLLKLKDLVGKIDEAWEQFGQKDLDDNDKSQLGDLPETVNELYSLFVGDYLPVQVAQSKRPFLCEIKIPEQQRLRRVLQAVGLSELRAFILSLKTGEDSQKSLTRTILYLEETILASKFGFKETSDDLRVCDPPEHVRGETFGEFLGLFQGVSLNTGHTNAPAKTGKCPKYCDNINKYQMNKCHTWQDGFNQKIHCPKKECNGRLFGCFSSGTVVYCALGKDSDRRFPWVQAAYKRWGNPSSECNGTQEKLSDIDTYFLKCSMCLCICSEEDEGSSATRTISLVPQFADIQNNMVVTGVRFQQQDNIFHVQIEESKLEAHMEIDPSSSKWKKFNSFKYNARKGTYSMKKGKTKVELFEEFDFKFLNWDERSINLDKIKAKKGEVIVGVGLRYNSNEKAVEIQIVSWPVDVKTGELEDPVDLDDEEVEVDWITWENTQSQPKEYQNKRFTISLANLDDPVKASKNPRLSDPNDQVKVQTTGFEKDMAQHTIPYIDLQGVTFPEQKAPLTAIELIYKRAKGFGGFISFKVISYDLIDLLHDGMSQEDIDKYQADFNG
ncbi:GSCOCG00009195001-RA-CDS [Cotesia congregata]|uniref:Uncharacterized protein n=1 Tax=Cotesia congregata TaxID=51543 RepID=A0A8J2H7D5_COTCN|nr:GSCOCG00009195001-RA-CDS [Cotesia congregata]CAG5078743.1 Protein of unknown function [Cotesia congregata]